MDNFHVLQRHAFLAHIFREEEPMTDSKSELKPCPWGCKAKHGLTKGLRVALETTSKGLGNANTEWQKEIKLREHQGHQIGKLHSQLDRAKFLATDTRNDALREAVQYHKDAAQRIQDAIGKDSTPISSLRYGERMAGHSADADAILALIAGDKP